MTQRCILGQPSTYTYTHSTSNRGKGEAMERQERKDGRRSRVAAWLSELRPINPSEETGVWLTAWGHRHTRGCLCPPVCYCRQILCPEAWGMADEEGYIGVHGRYRLMIVVMVVVVG